MTEEKPIVAENNPQRVDLEQGKTYFFCTCGRSKNQPFCDGSHKGTAFKPQSFEGKGEKVSLCQCKYSNRLPFCDGTHRQIDDQYIGKHFNLEKENDEVRPKSTQEEPSLELIHTLAEHGLKTVGAHGPMTAMGVPGHLLPKWDDIQILVAQLYKKPLPEDALVDSSLTVGPKAKKPNRLSIPIIVSDMSFGALSLEAKCGLSKGAELVGTGICSGEGGMLPEENALNTRYFYELASGMFGYEEEQLKNVQAFHFKAGQAAKTGIGGHLPACKNTGKISEVRKLKQGQAAVSPPSFTDLSSVEDFKSFSNRVREVTSGIPIGMKMSANHIEQDLEFALNMGIDYIILDGRGGGTGAAPEMFRDNISVPTIPALARAHHFLKQSGKREDITLFITGGLRTPVDFVKALALGADGIAIANSAIQAIGCLGARMCHTNLCPAGIATQDEKLRAKINIDKAAHRLSQFLTASVSLMKVMARACGHHALSEFNQKDITTWSREMHHLTGIQYAGMKHSDFCYNSK